VFYKNTDYENTWKQNAGHATILGSQPTLTDAGKLVFKEYSINADGNKYGETEVTFIKNDAGDWIKEDHTSYQLIGFGRIDEEGINKTAEEKKSE